MAKPPPSLRLEGWPAGVNNRAAPFALPAGACRQAVNVDVRQSGKLARRAGYVRLVADAGAHSLYSDAAVTLYVAGGQLKQLAGATAAVLAAQARQQEVGLKERELQLKAGQMAAGNEKTAVEIDKLVAETQQIESATAMSEERGAIDRDGAIINNRRAALESELEAI